VVTSTRTRPYDAAQHLRNYAPHRATSRAAAVKRRHARKMWERIRAWLPESPRVLEIGPGHGAFAEALEGTGARYDAIEPSDALREELCAAGLTVTSEPVPPIDRPDRAYDLVYGAMLLENLPSMHEAGAFACEALRVLAPGGVLVLYSPDYVSWGSFFFDEHYTHSFVTSERRVRHLLETQGFEVARICRCLGWLTVRGNGFDAVLRVLVRAAMAPLALAPVRMLLSCLGLGELVWRLRKTFFVGIQVIARRPR
jgi:SAM-dependent methyltransferase